MADYRFSNFLYTFRGYLSTSGTRWPFALLQISKREGIKNPGGSGLKLEWDMEWISMVNTMRHIHIYIWRSLCIHGEIWPPCQLI